MSQSRGRFIMASTGSLPVSYAPFRAIEAATSAHIVFAPLTFAAELEERFTTVQVTVLPDDLPLAAATDDADYRTKMLDDRATLMRWYSDAPLFSQTASEDQCWAIGCNAEIEYVPSGGHINAALEFAGIQTPVDTTVGSNCEEAAAMLVRDPANTISQLASCHPDAPVLVIRNAGTIKQSVRAMIVADSAATDLEPNDVVTVNIDESDRYPWFENLPLFGRRILVTRALNQCAAMNDRIRHMGGEPVVMPVIAFDPWPDVEKLDSAIDRLPDYDWVIFTSANGVRQFFSRLDHLQYDARQLAGPRIACIGSATAETLRSYTVNPDLVPDTFIAESVLEALVQQGIEGRRVLIPRAEVAREILPDGLRHAGATADVVPVYRTTSGQITDSAVLTQLHQGNIDVVTFTSSSTVTNLITMLNGDISCLKHSHIACIGPITARTAEEAGLTVDIVSKEHTTDGLLDAMQVYFERSTT